MLFMILLGLAFVPATIATAPTSVSPQDGAAFSTFARDEPRKECANPSIRMAEERQRGAQARRLDELPPGRLELTVLREIDGCVIPAVVHESLGGNPDPEGGDRR